MTDVHLVCTVLSAAIPIGLGQDRT